MITSFKRGEDIHAVTVAKVFNVALNEVTREQRGDAKAVNFGIIYGQGAYPAQQLNKSRTEAKELIDSYYTNFPKLKQYIASQVSMAREQGYVENILGRRRYLKNINSHNAIVRAGDIIKIAMKIFINYLDKGNYNSKMLLQVHDELVFDMHLSELAILKPLIVKEIENAFQLSVPLTVDLGKGENWLKAY